MRLAIAYKRFMLTNYIDWNTERHQPKTILKYPSWSFILCKLIIKSNGLWETLGDFERLFENINYLLVSWILFSCLLSIPKQMVDNSCLLQSLGLQISAISVGTPTCNPNHKKMDISFIIEAKICWTTWGFENLKWARSWIGDWTWAKMKMAMGFVFLFEIE